MFLASLSVADNPPDSPVMCDMFDFAVTDREGFAKRAGFNVREASEGNVLECVDEL
jgi:hypothetical protein